jgi:hypothetical protein
VPAQQPVGGPPPHARARGALVVDLPPRRAEVLAGRDRRPGRDGRRLLGVLEREVGLDLLRRDAVEDPLRSPGARSTPRGPSLRCWHGHTSWSGALEDPTSHWGKTGARREPN